jgi:hypothetical protein
MHVPQVAIFQEGGARQYGQDGDKKERGKYLKLLAVIHRRCTDYICNARKLSTKIISNNSHTECKYFGLKLLHFKM